MKLEPHRLTAHASDAAALVLTAVAIGVFVLTATIRLTEVRATAAHQADLQITMQMEQPPAPVPPTPPVRQKVPERHVLRVVAKPVEPIPVDPAPIAASAIDIPAISAPAPASEPVAVSDPDLDAQYAAELRADIDRRTFPPDSTQYRLRHPSGEVKVLFVVTRAGQTRTVTVLHSSGSEILDNAALNIVSSGHYAPMPAKAFVGEAQHTFLVTIEFRPANRALL